MSNRNAHPTNVSEKTLSPRLFVLSDRQDNFTTFFCCSSVETIIQHGHSMWHGCCGKVSIKDTVGMEYRQIKDAKSCNHHIVEGLTGIFCLGLF